MNVMSWFLWFTMTEVSSGSLHMQTHCTTLCVVRALQELGEVAEGCVEDIEMKMRCLFLFFIGINGNVRSFLNRKVIKHQWRILGRFVCKSVTGGRFWTCNQLGNPKLNEMKGRKGQWPWDRSVLYATRLKHFHFRSYLNLPRDVTAPDPLPDLQAVLITIVTSVSPIHIFHPATPNSQYVIGPLGSWWL